MLAIRVNGTFASTLMRLQVLYTHGLTTLQRIRLFSRLIWRKAIRAIEVLRGFEFVSLGWLRSECELNSNVEISNS